MFLVNSPPYEEVYLDAEQRFLCSTSANLHSASSDSEITENPNYSVSLISFLNQLIFIYQVKAGWAIRHSTSFHLRGVWWSILPVPCTAPLHYGAPAFLFSLQPITLLTPLSLSSTHQSTHPLSSWMLWRVVLPRPIVRPSLCRLTPGQPCSQQTVAWILEDDSNMDE